MKRRFHILFVLIAARPPASVRPRPDREEAPDPGRDDLAEVHRDGRPLALGPNGRLRRHLGRLAAQYVHVRRLAGRYGRPAMLRRDQGTGHEHGARLVARRPGPDLPLDPAGKAPAVHLPARAGGGGAPHRGPERRPEIRLVARRKVHRVLDLRDRRSGKGEGEGRGIRRPRHRRTGIRGPSFTSSTSPPRPRSRS